MIVISITTTKANPLTTGNSNPKGSGLFSKSLQSLTDNQQIADKSYEAFIGMASGDATVVRRDYKQFHGFDTKARMREHIEFRLGFNKGSFNDENMLKVFENMKWMVVGKNFWDHYASGYVLPGVSEFRWWDPRNSTIYRNRTQWVVWYIEVEGSPVYLFVGNCGNPIGELKGTDPGPTTELEDFDEEYAETPSAPKKKMFSEATSNVGNNTATATNTNNTTVNIPPQGEVKQKDNSVLFGILGLAGGYALGRLSNRQQQVGNFPQYQRPQGRPQRSNRGYSNNNTPRQYNYTDLNPVQYNNTSAGNGGGQYNTSQLNHQISTNNGGGRLTYQRKGYRR